MKTIQTERLTEEQILKLLAEYRKTESSRARDRLVLQYTNLVESVGRRFAGAGEPVEDLVQEGYIGLISAVERFDVTKGVKFSTFATHFVIGQIKHYLRDKGKIIKEPAWLQELNQRMSRIIESLSQQHGRQPTDGEIAEVMRVPEEDVHELLTTREVFKVSSLDGERDDNNGSASDADKAKRQKLETFQLPLEEKIVLETALDRLKAIEQQVIDEYFFKDLNQTETAKKLGISCNYVSHILRKSTKKLRKMLTTEELQEVQVQMRAMHRRASAGAQTHSSVTDPSTQLYTRVYFLARVEEELSRAIRHGYPLALMLLTLEMKSEILGHWVPLTAPERLYQIASTVKDRVRKGDIVGRYSENQFGLLLPHTGSAGENVCHRLEAIVEDVNAAGGHEALALRSRLTFVTFPDGAANFAELLDAVEHGRPIAGAVAEQEEALPAAA